MSKELPFSWKIRLSARARRPRITLDKFGLVELVWPAKSPTSTAQQMMQEHAGWVLQHLAQCPPRAAASFPPVAIDLQGVGRKWQLRYQESDANRFVMIVDDGQLLIHGPVLEHNKLRLFLCGWLKQQGKLYLLPMLADIAQDMGENYAAVSIRLQKRRWGSCSLARRINLNAALLFLPEYLVRHVLIHELAHLKHHNHSAKFWAWVAQYDPDYQQCRKALREQGEQVPSWLTQPC